MGLPENFATIHHRIADACGRAGRDASSVTLLAVSKGIPPELIAQAADHGQVAFGESKVQEAKAKIPLCPSRCRWQMIGHLQSNKCRDAVQMFDMIQSVDSVALANELNKWADKFSKCVPVLLEVNVAGESSKFGLNPDRVVDACIAINSLSRLEVHGLMTIAPWTPDPEKVRPAFRRLRELKVACEEKLGAPLPHLSMGMSDDFEVAIEEGSTIIRIGTALFGARPKPSRPASVDDAP
ncbi:MAG TPA: YggS family pyridoxal phosphate-dependent enzyme [Candidatus Acidoferrum sp.]|nr:YggS family pyridoxal phosphate-dependent enzyme [Candidatus Acidoferrum sp.]